MSASPVSASPKDWREALSREEIDRLLEMNDLRSCVSVVVDWGLIFASFALVAAWPNPLTIVLALFVIGGRQLGLAILMHEAAHRILFKSRAVNDFVGNWLCAYPVWNDTAPYRAYHLQHHARAGTAEDPDLGLSKPFPVTKASMRRKVWRDLSGQTGWKRAVATLRRDLGLSRGRAKREETILALGEARKKDALHAWGGARALAGLRNLRGVLVTNLALLALLTLAGHPALYLLWVAAWFTTFSLIMRIRSIAEHGMVPDPPHPVLGTRTTLVRWWERLFLAPNRVNYHLEHHLLMTVPHYRLPELHRLLRERGALEGACIAHGYPEVLRLATSRG